MDWGTANLEMLSRFYAKYPEYAERTFLSVKGGIDVAKHAPNGSYVISPLRSIFALAQAVKLLTL